jgi:hypothetical protein
VSRVHTIASWTVELATNSVEANREASEIVLAAAFLCQRYAQQVAPRDTGNLVGSISVGRPGEGAGSLIPGDLTAEVGPTAEYGYWVEYGNSRGAKPQPYMLPASEQAGEWFVNEMSRSVGIR